jgi:hypothetical protein
VFWFLAWTGRLVDSSVFFLAWASAFGVWATPMTRFTHFKRALLIALQTCKSEPFIRNNRSTSFISTVHRLLISHHGFDTVVVTKASLFVAVVVSGSCEGNGSRRWRYCRIISSASCLSRCLITTSWRLPLGSRRWCPGYRRWCFYCIPARCCGSKRRRNDNDDDDGGNFPATTATPTPTHFLYKRHLCRRVPNPPVAAAPHFKYACAPTGPLSTRLCRPLLFAAQFAPDAILVVDDNPPGVVVPHAL